MFKNKYKFIIFFLVFILIPLAGCSLIKSNKDDSESMSNLTSDAVLFDSAKIKDSTMALLNNAAKSIYIEQVAIDDQAILNTLISKAHQGVDVKILLDQWQRENQNTLKLLKNENVYVQLYPSQKGQNQKSKFLVVDNQTAVFYGAGWTAAGLKSHSAAVRLDGTSVLSIAKLFSDDWEFTTTVELPLTDKPQLQEDQIVFAKNAGIKQSLLKLISSSAAAISIEAEQVSDSDIVNALIAAKKRGCTIQLIVNPSSAPGGSDSIKEMKEAGIDIRNYKNTSNSPLGLNIGIFDNKTVLLSSSGWTYFTFVTNHECSITVPSTSIANTFNTVFKQDWSIAGK